MNIEIFDKFINNLRNYINTESQKGLNVLIYEKNHNPTKYFDDLNINVALEMHKEIILQEETRLELGGVNKKSFSLIYPFSDQKFINKLNNGRITLIGLNKNEITQFSIHFGMVILIGGKKISEEDWDSLRQFNFISDGIEGFLVRTIPRKFWCRIGEKLINNFTFDFLGNAIFYLYKQRFAGLIESMEIFFVNTFLYVIDDFIEITSNINTFINEKWLKKIENWKKRIDCDYDWGCEICPYQEECYDIKQALVEREKIGR
jgi:CO dehydrogenase/acetyl-CoA synthase beta subunit